MHNFFLKNQIKPDMLRPQIMKTWFGAQCLPFLLPAVIWYLNDWIGVSYYTSVALPNIIGKICVFFRPLLLLALLEILRDENKRTRILLELAAACLVTGSIVLLVNYLGGMATSPDLMLYDYLRIAASITLIELLHQLGKSETKRPLLKRVVLLGVLLLIWLLKFFTLDAVHQLFYANWGGMRADRPWFFYLYSLFPSIFYSGNGLSFLLLGWIGYCLSRKTFCKLIALYSIASWLAAILQFEFGIDLTAFLGTYYCDGKAACFALAIPFILLSGDKPSAPLNENRIHLACVSSMIGIPVLMILRELL